jgi:flagellar hook protein FlgE
MGWMADQATGKVDTTTTPSDQLVIPNGITYAVPTSKCVIGGNLDSSTAVATPQQLTYDIYDTLGAKHRIDLSFSKTADNAWSWTATSPDSTVGASSTGTVTFNASGQVTGSTGSINLPLLASNGASSMTSTLDLSSMTQLSGTTSVILSNQDGMPLGGMTGFSVDTDGMIYGNFDNGASRLIGQISVARFTNPSGLSREGSNLWRTTPNSGTPTLLRANLAGSQIRSRYLEMSNVDLATEFASMIVSQRSFQANSKSITTSDELMQELMQLKR